jgi:hypothetical protein
MIRSSPVRFSSALAFVLVGVGCTGDDSDTGVDEPAPTCAVRLVETEPVEAAVDAYIRGTVEFELTDADPFATIVMDGVAGTVSTRGSRGQVVVFTPDAPLTPRTSYTATLSWCGGTESLSFTTSDAGLPLEEDTSALAGRVYSVPFRSGRIVEPDGAAGVLGQYLTQTDLLRVDSASGGTLQVTNALARNLSDPPEQDWCVPTEAFEPADFTGAPTFTLHAERVRMLLAGVVVELQGLEVSGTFLPDGRSMAGGEVRYIMDMRPLAPMVDPTDPGSVCAAAAQFDEVCEPCPDSGEPYCLRFHLDQLEGTLVEGLGLDPVPGVDCPACDTTPPAQDAECE